MEKRVSASPGARALVVEIPRTGATRTFQLETSSRSVQRGERRPSKRPKCETQYRALACTPTWLEQDCLLRRRHHSSRTDSIARLAGQLDRHQVAGMIVKSYPDNSVVCHARRDAGLRQDVFLTGAVLGVHCNNLPLSFFPDIYNEDWVFFAPEAASRQLPSVGCANAT